MEKERITVETTVSAGINKAWKYWTLPRHVVNWNSASDDWHCPKAENDLKAGGRFNYTMASRDGKISFDFEGVYDEVTDKQKIAFLMSDGRQVVIVFEDQGDRTKVTETFDPENTNSREMQRAGWQSILDNFKKYVESK